MSDRMLANEQAEQAVLGALLIEPERVWPEAVEMGTTPATYYLPRNRVIAETIDKMMTERRPVDLVTVSAAIAAAGNLDRVGGEMYLNHLIEACTTAANSAYYIDLIRQEEIKRQLVAIAREIEQEACQAERGDTVAMKLPEMFARLALPEGKEPATAEILAANVAKWREARKHEGKCSTGIELPWPTLNNILSGLETGLTILGGRPSAGKTTMEDQIALYAAEMGVPVARWTLDSTKADLWARAQARAGGVSLPKLKFGYGRDDQLAEIEAQNKRLATLPIWMNARARDLRAGMAWARQMQLRENIGLLTVDYCTQVQVSDMGRMQWDKVARTTHVAESMKALALELEIPVLLIAQLSRQVEKDDRSPQMSDLRDSGALEQEANKIAFLYIDKKKANEMDEKRPNATKHKRPVVCAVVKNKDGETGDYPMWFYPPYFRFTKADISADGKTAFIDDDLADTDIDNKTTAKEGAVSAFATQDNEFNDFEETGEEEHDPGGN